VTVDDTSVFFTNPDPRSGGSGIMRAPKAGGTPTAIANGSIPKAAGIAIDGATATLFASTPDGRIVRVNKDGSGYVELATDQPDPRGVAVDESNVYWVDTASGEVWTADKAVGRPRLIAASQRGVTTVVVDRDRIYWATSTSIMRVAK
jgi:sugar lactone lactonase YvrE